MKSFRDPGYDQLEQNLAPDMAGFLRTIRVNGERSNADQVSSAGARSVYQIIPETRARIIKQAGFDPWASPQNAVRGAAIVAKDAMRWAKGDPVRAAGYYHAGGNTAQWGPKTAAYMQRTGGNMNPFDQFDTKQTPVANPFDRFDGTDQKPARKPMRIIDNAKPDKNLLDEYSLPERAIIGAGKAATDFLHGIGIGDSLGLVRGDEKADKQLMSDPAAITGNMLGQAGIMYTGGKALQTLGTGAQLLTKGRDLTKVGQLVQKGGQLLQKGGNAVINPSTYKQAALVGGGYGLVSQPGGIDQRLINAAAGAAGGTAGLAFGRGLGNVGRKVKGAFTPSQQVETTLTTQLQAKGIDFNALPRAIQQQLVKAGKQSRDLGNLDTEQLARLADFEKLGIKPTRGWLTRDAKDWWTENNLNTVDSQLAARYKDANQALLEGVRDGTSQATDYDLGNRLQDTLSGYDAMLKSNVDQLYGAARNAAGRDLPLDPHRFVNDATIELDQQMLGSKLPADTLNWFQKATSGKEPFDMGTALQRLQAINGRLSSTSDMAEAKALGIVKKHLTDAIDGYGGTGTGNLPRVGGDQQQELAAAFRQARTAAADRFRFQESNPLVDQVLKGKFTPEKLPDMLGSMKVDDLKGLAALEYQRGMPLLSTLRDAAKVYVRDAATLQAETGGSFTVAGLRRALDRIGPEKGKILFGADGWDQYHRILTAAGNIHNAPIKPAGSSTAPNMLRLLSQTPIPGMPWMINATTTAVSKANQMANVGRALNPTIQLPPVAGQLSSRLPLLSVPGLLTLEEAQR
ncbi:hypothetical protein ACG97_05985 [Vogesella sp. EB]|uniref:lytic transglycosylase domain-containing protein n=1 Tax=Vogesella sp. EB TaxID=1526735 RepID=UPI00064D168C|nr:lytic transglycosylase domain-containing protein [Vogesella sp. EB]KMJ53793.1 hypothetical protein ACG97_05985 [Vogesella sp. EB]